MTQIISGYVILAVLLSVGWIWFATLGRRNGASKPTAPLILTFLMGAIIAAPAAVIEHAIGGLMAVTSTTTLIFTGPVEEFSKYAATRFGRKATNFTGRPTLYAVYASMGFAVTENVIYLMSFGPEAILIRAPIATPNHLALGLVWGRCMELSERVNNTVLKFVITAGSLALAAGLHSAYNLAASNMGWLLAAPVAVAAILWIWLGYPRGRSQDVNRAGRCPYCHGAASASTGFCPACGMRNITV